jgi:hypothetical protein
MKNRASIATFYAHHAFSVIPVCLPVVSSENAVRGKFEGGR